MAAEDKKSTKDLADETTREQKPADPQKPQLVLRTEAVFDCPVSDYAAALPWSPLAGIRSVWSPKSATRSNLPPSAST